MTPLLQVLNICFRYVRREVLDHISLELHQGTCTALVGPNGAGKTTLLRIIAGALAPAAGRVLFAGQPLGPMPPRLRSRLIASVPQQLEMPFDFTVEEIVQQGRTPYLGFLGGLMADDRHAVDRALSLTDTSHLRGRIFNELSGGERQRVKIALGLAQEPRLLLLDEPTQNLDIGRQAELIDLLQTLCGEGITIFASMHDLHLVPGNFSMVHLFNPDGSLLSGTPEEVLTSSNLSRAFDCTFDHHPLHTLATTSEASR